MMKAAIFKNKETPLVVGEYKKPVPVKDQVLVKLSYAALNHRDLWLMHDTIDFPEGVIPGSDGVGVVEAVGPDANPQLVGTEVVINPSLNWGDNPVVQSEAFRILGIPDNGTFAEYLAISQNQIFEKPEHLSMEESAGVPLAGLTAYRALFTKARLRVNEKVLITGIGGGAALWALQFAVAYKARVYVTSGSDEKIERAKQLGATDGFNYREPHWSERATKEAGGFDVIIDCAGGPQFGTYIELAVPGGRIVNFGRTAGNITEIATRLLYWKQIIILGSTMGTRDEFLSMLHFMESRNISPVIDQTFPLANIHEALSRMQAGSQFGKIVVKVS